MSRNYMKVVRDRYKQIKVPRQVLFGVLLLWIVSFIIDIWPVLFLGLFCIANAILLSIDRYIQAPIDVEFSTFAAVLMTTVYGVKWGILVAVCSKLAAIAYNRNIRVDHFFMIFGYILAALMAEMLPSMDILILGIIVTIIVNIYVFLVSKFITMLSHYEILMYGLSNLVFNIVLFIGFSNLFQTLMTLAK